MLPHNLSELSLQAIKSLVTAGLRESRTLDFKRDPVGSRDEDKKEFLADVSAFANTAGGDLIFGIEENAGEATNVSGIQLANIEDEKLRLEQILRSGLEPRLPKVDIHWIHDGEIGVLVVRVPRSYVAPHRIIYRDNGKFYGRHSTGKYPLDVSELRAAFLSAEGVVEGIKKFRRERLAAIESDDGALPVNGAPLVVFHIVPLSAFSTANQIRVDDNRNLLLPMMSGSGIGARHTLDGYVTYLGLGAHQSIEQATSYTLLFRSGIVEAVCGVGATDPQNRPYIPPSAVEWPILCAYKQYMEKLKFHGIEPPLYISVSILGTRGQRLLGNRNLSMRAVTLTKDEIILPETIVYDLNAPADQTLRSTFDLLWNTFGYPRSFSFDENNKYIGEKF